LFLLYINDLPSNIQDADEINTLITDKNIDTTQERLNRVNSFETWFSNNSLILNTDKTKAMSFHYNKT
jgi:hypothetical protein